MRVYMLIMTTFGGQGLGQNVTDARYRYERYLLRLDQASHHRREQSMAPHTPARDPLCGWGKCVLLWHGSPRSHTEYLFVNCSNGCLRQLTADGRADARADVIVFGHTHVPYHRGVDGVYVASTGSVGRSKDGDARAGDCLLSIEENQVTSEQVRLPSDVGRACSRLAEAGLPEYVAEYLHTDGEVPQEWVRCRR
jgi:Calcineurin-like phosphoesterase superfamily domain